MREARLLSHKPLSSEELEDVLEIAAHPGLAAIVKHMAALVAHQEANVISYNLANGSDRGLALLKAEADGARKLHLNLSQWLTSVRKRQEAISD